MAAGLRGLACQPEVQDLGRAVVGHVDVVGLQVAMDDAARVRGGEAADDLPRQIDDSSGRQRPAVDERAQCFSFEQLGDEERHAAGADVEDREHVGVR